MSYKATYEKWKTAENLDSFVQENLRKIENDETQIEDAFYKTLEFGTAGMRGKMGAGTNRMNVYTIRQATEGLAQYLLDDNSDNKNKGVAIAYDSRHFSQEFAFEAARTLGKHGIKAYVFEELRTTPELSFAVRYLKAASGIMITASHNPPEYNGYKVYNEQGGQLLPDEANKLTDFVNAVEKPLEIEVPDQESLIEKGLIEIIGKKVDKEYLELMKSVNVRPDIISEMASDVKIVYTPLHGTGQTVAKDALWNAGFKNMYYVEEQMKPDPNFSTVESPNPEDTEAFEMGIKLAKEKDADVVIATDPDADRLGLATKVSDGVYDVLTGNQIASLMAEYILKAHMDQGTLPKNAAIIKSIVSSDLPQLIADSYGVVTDEVLTGFKFIAEKIQEYKDTASNTFMLGFEESYGYLTQPFVRDKDAIQALVLISEIAAYHKKDGNSLMDALLDIYHKHGHYIERTISIKLDGKEGLEKIQSLLKDLRENPLEDIAGYTVRKIEDYSSQKWTNQDGESGTIDLPSANVLKYYLSDGAWVAIRPSGTEPKIKFYVSVHNGSRAEALGRFDEIEEAVTNIVNS